MKEGLEKDEKKVKIHEVPRFRTQLESRVRGRSMQRLILDTFTHPEKFRSVTVRR